MAHTLIGPWESLSNTERDGFYVGFYLSTGLSFLGGALVVWIHLLEREANLSRRLIFWVAVVDALHSVGFWINPSIPHTENSSLCQFQGFLLDFTPVASFLLLVAYGIHLFRVVVLRVPLPVENRIRLWYLLLPWIWPILVVIVNLSGGFYGPTDDQILCWIKDSAVTWRLCEFSLVFILSYFILAVLYLWIARELYLHGKIMNQRQQSTEEILLKKNEHDEEILAFNRDDNIEQIRRRKQTEKNEADVFFRGARVLQIYLIVFFVCWAPLIINSSWNYANGSSPIVIGLIQLTLTSAQGFFNALVYNYQPLMKYCKGGSTRM